MWLIVREQTTTEDFQDGHLGGHLGYLNNMILAVLNLHVAPIPPTKFWLTPTYNSSADVVWGFSRLPLWCHIGYQNRTILAILNLYVASMPPLKFPLHPTYGLGGDITFEEFQDSHLDSHLGYRNWTILAILNLHVSPMPCTKFRLNLTYPSWILEWNDFSRSEFPCRSNASHHVSAQTDLQFGRILFAEFQDGRYEQNNFSNSESLCHLPSGFSSIWLKVRENDVLWTISRWRPCWISEQKILKILNLHVTPMPPTKFGLNLTEFGSRCGLKTFKMAAVADILEIWTEQF